MKSKDVSFLYPFLPLICSGASRTYRARSHNDYQQDVPFWKVISAGVPSLEGDVFLKDGKPMVAHEGKNIRPDRTLGGLYLGPMEGPLELGPVPKAFQLPIDVKSEPKARCLQL